MIIYFLIFFASIIFILSKTKPDPIHGVYEQAGYLGIVKQIFMYIIIRYVTSIILKIFMFVNIRLRKRKVEHKAVGHNQAWLGLAAEDDISIMESPRPLVDHPLACDAVWFGGGSKDGTCIVLSGMKQKLEKILQIFTVAKVTLETLINVCLSVCLFCNQYLQIADLNMISDVMISPIS